MANKGNIRRRITRQSPGDILEKLLRDDPERAEALLKNIARETGAEPLRAAGTEERK
jgi:hypothetical protein